MPITITQEKTGSAFTVRLRGKLEKDDFEKFAPELDRLIRQHGKIDLLVELDEFEGWRAEALWEDLKFDLRHFSDVRRLALVGDKRWHEWMATFCKPFTTAEVEYFGTDQLAKAREWMLGKTAAARS